MAQIRELTELKKVLGSQFKSAKQTNGLFESDCEIVKLAAKSFLVTSIDSLGEEITIGLYKELKTWAWMTVMSSVSDLAASGASPIGITLSTQWAFATSKDIQKKFFAEIKKACVKSQVPLLGGDSGYAKDHVFTSSILGQSTTPPLTRIGAKAGDYLVLAHGKNTGVGPALAYRYLLNLPDSALPEKIFRPHPSWQLTQNLRPLLSAAIDTSDGLGPCMYILALLNDLGFELQWQEGIHHRHALQFCQERKISPVMLWLGDQGDFQSLYVVPQKNISKLPKKGLSILGQFQKKKSYNLRYQNHNIALPFADIANCGRDVDSYARLFDSNVKYLNRYL
ncbi:hypothetical protein AZI86_04235 [Bdellovibrio bacteriovorus]|uniref:PurM-like N-terminal domain-containing protein n=1 Tax=Bdellovibrio bacteriovorus TaxID=959 RepID=A0A150WPM4_BDEBC|nr:AIR synthase related protein [Bdellovibrio bacteriovorus]KYG66274.1 hypothetical protein AZI86_04235 [Bdellovibrio bacteriovorus]